MTTGKTIALTSWTFVDKVMSLLLNMLSRLVITFLPRSKHLLISWLQSASAVILEPRKIKSASVLSDSILFLLLGRDFIFLGSKITEDGDCSHEIKRLLPLGRKAMTNLDSILKNRDITLLTKVRLFKAMVFPVVMFKRESWTIKKAEHQRINAFEL